IREIGSGAFAAAESAQAVAAFDETGYRAQWRSLVSPDQQPPAVDFATESAVFILGGQRPTGGYSVVVNGAALEGETLVVDAIVEGPPAGAITTQVITSPYAVIAVKSRAFRNVRWSAEK
ncbi:MAG TPA: protease complex subunit PrcB family protein, partial [Thermoanaerobaculia bacterium]|nr:protease complex subunit PrcB family protein [Thermoanaerobaculia bacterium]